LSDLSYGQAPSLILSIFPGADLLGRAFEEFGYCVVRGPDLVWGGDVRDFHAPAGRFDGVIGGSPCQDFSRARRCEPTGLGLELLAEFRRVVTEAAPTWWLLENVPGVPDCVIPRYVVQRFNLSAREFGSPQRRLRTFQFGRSDLVGLVIRRQPHAAGGTQRCAMASEGGRQGRRSFADFCELQGLPRDFDLPGLSVSAKYRAVGNGVPLPMGRAVAAAIRDRADTRNVRVCVCDCGRPVSRNQSHATAACRKRMERRRRGHTVSRCSGSAHS